MAATCDTPNTPAAVVEALEKSNKLIGDLTTEVKAIRAENLEIKKENEGIKKALAEPQRGPYVTTGPVGKDSAPYSILKVAGWCLGSNYVSKDQIKNEFDLHERIKSYLNRQFGYSNMQAAHGNRTFFMPCSSEHLPVIENDDEARALKTEIRQKMTGMQGQFDPDHYDWLAKRTDPLGVRAKAMGVQQDSAGGVLIGFPTLGELIDLQRKMEVFPNAGATEIGLPPNGRLQFPKLTGGATAYWVGEAQQITESQESTGYLDLIAKKLGILVKMNNELVRYASPTAEAMIRLDMARVAARKADLAMLEGTGGTQPKGLLTYDTASSWSEGTDKLLTVSATANTLAPADLQKMIQVLPDGIDPTAWVMRRQMWRAIQNFRADAVTTGDAAGPFLFSQFRQLGERLDQVLLGYPVVASSQVSTARTSTYSYVLAGYFPDWIIARFGVMEFLATQLGDTSFQNDQTWLRGIQLLDAGPRHAASFVLCDNIGNNGGA